MPLEAQRLGLEAHASDLNPVAVLINKAMIEIPPRFAGRPPVNPEFRGMGVAGAEAGTRVGKPRRAQARIGGEQWRGAQGLAEDVRHYGRWMREEAEKRIGHLYPKVEMTSEMVRERPDLKPYEGRKLTVIAWLWARTVRSPNPAFADVEVPLVSTWMLSTKKGKEAYVEPVIEGRGYRFEVRAGAPPDLAAAKAGTKSGGSHSAFRCLMSGTPMPFAYLRAEGRAQRLGTRLIAIVAQGTRGRVYVPAFPQQQAVAESAASEWTPDVPICHWPGRTNVVEYGLTTFGELFTPRQLVALTTFSDLVGEATERVHVDAVAAGLPDDGRPLRDGGSGATAYAEAVGLYLALAVSKTSNVSSSITSWMSDRGAFRETFARQAIPMVWDFAEANSFAGLGGSFDAALAKGAMAIEALPAEKAAWARQMDAVSQASAANTIVSTDPPYYDNIGYADLSDYFYVWLRRSVPFVFPSLFATLAVPKNEELVATPYRHGGKAAAEMFFLAGMTRAMRRLAKQAHTDFPVTIYYAFKQSERRGDSGVGSTGWETFLAALIESGLSVTGTWPMRTEGAAVSYTHLSCRRRG